MKARIKGTPFEVDAKPYYDDRCFAGFVDEDGLLYRLGELEFVDERPQNAEVFLEDCFVSWRLLNIAIAVLGTRHPTLGDIADKPRYEWLRCRNFGAGTMQELERVLQENGLRFKDEEGA